MKWQAILLGVVASWPVGAWADCAGIEVTYGDPDEVRCLPWVDWGTPRIETIPPRFLSSVTVFEVSQIEALGAYDISELTRIDPWYDIPELD
jgi:hypothetical protein